MHPPGPAPPKFSAAYVPPHAKFAYLEPFGPEHVDRVWRAGVVCGRHMNCAGGSWSRGALHERALVARADHSRAGGDADGMHWVAYSAARAPIALTSIYRPPGTHTYVHRAYFAPATPRETMSGVVAAALDAFHRTAGHDYAVVTADCFRSDASEVFEAAGYVPVLHGKMVRKTRVNGRSSGRVCDVLVCVSPAARRAARPSYGA